MIDLQAELKGTFEILSESENLKIRLKPLPTWSYFHGHFPSQPILPAVGIVDISRYFIETYLLKAKLSFKKISQFRIRTPVQPEQIMLLVFEKDGEFEFHVTWKNENENSISADLNMLWI